MKSSTVSLTRGGMTSWFMSCSRLFKSRSPAGSQRGLSACLAGGQILATDAIRAAYHDGRGSIPMRGKVIIEGDTKADGNGNGSDGTTVVKAGKAGRGKTQRKRSGEGKPAVVITELPYQINKVCKPDIHTGTSVVTPTSTSTLTCGLASRRSTRFELTPTAV